MNSQLRAVATVYVFLQLLVGWVLIWLLQSLAKLVLFPFTTFNTRCDICGHIMRKLSFLTVDVLNPLWSTTILRPFPKMNSGHFLVAMNHLSNADPWIAIRPILPWDCKWVCKGSLFKIPFGGWALANSGDLEVRFTAEKDGWGTEKGSVSSMMNNAKTLLGRGQPIAVFPEGIRSKNPDGDLNEFKLGFFMLAVETNTPVVPIAFSGSEKAWPRGTWMFDRASIYCSCGDAISPVGLTPEQLRDKTVEAVRQMRETHPDRVALRKTK